MADGSSIVPSDFPDPEVDIKASPGAADAVAVFAGGCFWCTEAVYRELDGVKDVKAGYAGGTGHAEAIEIRYDPSRTTFGQLMKIFFSVAHDPTQLNRQGNDVGTQYRSAIFYADDEQRKAAQAYIAQLTRAKAFDQPIMTTLEPLEKFYVAEDYHQDYARLNPGQPYIAYVSAPKVSKLRKYYPDRLKKGGR